MIDLFFMENQNDELLQSEILKLKCQPETMQHVCSIFKAAALSESGRADSAKIILDGIRPETLQGRTLYYYNSTLALTQFRLNHLQQAFHTASIVMDSDVYDVRSLALTKRVMARIMYFYENYEYSLSLLHQSIAHYREARLEKSVAINQKFLASFYSELHSFNQAIEKIKESETTLKRYNDNEELFYLYIVAIKTYLYLQRIDSAQYYTKLAMETTDFSHSQQKLVSIYNYIGKIEVLQENWPAAIASFEKIIRIDNGFFGLERYKMAAFIELASIYNTLNRYEEAKENALQAIEFSKGHTWENLQYEAYRELSTAFQATDPKKTQTYLDLAQVSHDKFLRSSVKGIVNFTETQVELDKAAHEISQLQKDKRRNWILSLTTLLILVAANIVFIRISTRKKKEKVIKTQISIEQKESILYNDFKSWLEENKRYLQPGIDLSRASAEMGTNRSYLSKAINSHGVRFNEIVNRYRIQEVINILKNRDDPRHNYNMDELAIEVGFQTKSVFFDSFRKETGMSPRQFRENNRYANIPDDANTQKNKINTTYVF